MNDHNPFLPLDTSVREPSDSFMQCDPIISRKSAKRPRNMLPEESDSPECSELDEPSRQVGEAGADVLCFLSSHNFSVKKKISLLVAATSYLRALSKINT